MANKYYRVQMNSETKTTICPVCERVNNHIADAGNCEHLHKLTAIGWTHCGIAGCNCGLFMVVQS